MDICPWISLSVPHSSQLSGNCSLLGTNNIRGQITRHIFASNTDRCLYRLVEFTFPLTNSRVLNTINLSLFGVLGCGRKGFRFTSCQLDNSGEKIKNIYITFLTAKHNSYHFKNSEVRKRFRNRLRRKAKNAETGG